MNQSLKLNLIAAGIVGFFLLGLSLYPIWTIKIFFAIWLTVMVRLLMYFWRNSGF